MVGNCWRYISSCSCTFFFNNLCLGSSMWYVRVYKQSTGQPKIMISWNVHVINCEKPKQKLNYQKILKIALLFLFLLPICDRKSIVFRLIVQNYNFAKFTRFHFLSIRKSDILPVWSDMCTLWYECKWKPNNARKLKFGILNLQCDDT